MMVAGVILAVRALRSFTKVRMVKQIKVQNKLNYKASLSGRLVPHPSIEQNNLFQIYLFQI